MATQQEALEALSQLTKRQRQVAVLVAHGLCADEVAARISRSPATVKGHIQGAFKVLGISKVAQLAVLCTLAGEVSDWRAAA